MTSIPKISLVGTSFARCAPRDVPSGGRGGAEAAAPRGTSCGAPLFLTDKVSRQSVRAMYMSYGGERDARTNQYLLRSRAFIRGIISCPSALSYFRYLRREPSHTSLAVASTKRHSLKPLSQPVLTFVSQKIRPDYTQITTIFFPPLNATHSHGAMRKAAICTNRRSSGVWRAALETCRQVSRA